MDFGPALAITEGSSAEFSAVLADKAGVPIDSLAVTSIEATLVDVASGTVIRPAQNVKDANGGTLGVDGAFTLVLSGADTAAIGNRQYQMRRLILEVVFNGGILTSASTFFLKNFADYPA